MTDSTPPAPAARGQLLYAHEAPYLCFLGLAATRIWLQCNLFGSYVQSDDGLVSITSNLFYGLTMIVAAVLAFMRKPSRKLEIAMGGVSFFAMTLATLLLIAGKEMGLQPTVLGASIIAGIGGAVGGGMWTVAFRKLSLERSIFYGFASLGLGSLGGFLLGFLPNYTSYLVSAFMPALALICFQQACKTDDAPQAAKPVYNDASRTSMIRLMAGVAAFSLALGILRGFPLGEAVPMSGTMRAVHQLGVVALSLFVIWWATVAGRRLSFKLLWCLEVATAGLGMVVLTLFPGSMIDAGVAIVNIADTFMLGVLWVTLQDIARHTALHPYVVYGSVWAARVLFRNLGRVLIIAVGSSAAGITSITAIAAFAVALSMVLLMSVDLFKERPLLETNGEGDAAESEGAPGSGSMTMPHASTAAAGNAASATPRTSAPAAINDPAGNSATEAFREQYGLSAREMEVLSYLAQGRTKSYIAGALFVSENTVRAHTKRIYAKLGIHSKQELIDLVGDLRFS